ncbi:MAG: glutamyl-tRNA reductase [Gammaproteobacteria bacterium]|nr:glutamyl-tRNA reductase [Gammaproteobacteria bacterium]MBU2678053.1 glutamyl-tRNA reductase [Gammaproteobacteria bacterium]NNC58266.1 glutamyl-tRNA reductase [Woeseiaceae bacterium]NNL51788.1 glutamyl-tRNA reductase [Woeseiaceae bacterium]
MPLQILGLNHNTAPVEIREQVVFAGDEIPRALQSLMALDGVEESVLLSTCNRTEFYVMTSDGGRERLQAWLHDDRHLDPSFGESLFSLQEDDAIRHIFRVACGLDSMVLGEPQILGQLKDAFRHAQQAGTLGRRLSLLFQHTFAVAKKIRTDTEIGASPVSVASAAVNLANQFFAGFKKHTALLVGAGVTIELVAKHLHKRQIGRLFVANRNVERARTLAHQFGGFALPLSEIEGTLPEADILITSTAATEPVITLAQMEAAVKARKRKPIFAVDIAVPRDIEVGVADLDDVYLYTIDDLDRVIQEGQGNREAAAVEANRLLDEEIARYANIERSKQVVPVIAALREKSELLRSEVNAQARRRLARGESAEDAIEYATAALMKKLLHSPSVSLRKAGEASDEELIDAARALFGLGKD